MCHHQNTRHCMYSLPSNPPSTTTNSGTTTERLNRMPCFPATPYNTRTNAATLDLQSEWPRQHIPVYCKRWKFHAPDRALTSRTLYTNRPHLLLNTPVTNIQLLCITQSFPYLTQSLRMKNTPYTRSFFICCVEFYWFMPIFTLYDLCCISFIPICTFITVFYFLWLLRFDVCNFPPQILFLPRAIVMNVKCVLDFTY